ncbi:4141_t:CDS:2 [Acaulospora colombiana]|uniref:4141_t:CDS:1 n=1 Tax=Acaulospora colombiana TaxID=27376 RepID=A0ACA9MQC0_9GLOM|nr:4141_t:CDS:2 [Acaulospora colombiana]
MSISELVAHVTSGKREELNYELLPHGDDKKYVEIIRLAWEHDQLYRIEMATLFKSMLDLNHEYRQISKFESIITPKERSSSTENTAGKCVRNFNNAHSFIKIIPPVDDGIKAHDCGNYEEAWNIFESNSGLGNSTARFWVGKFYWNGIFVEEDKEKALEYYEAAANDGNSEAQYTYAMSLMDVHKAQSVKKKVPIIKNLKMAAANGHAKALNALGNIYLNGKLQTTVDEKLAIEYYKLAALKNHEDAINTLKEMNIDMYE